MYEVELAEDFMPLPYILQDRPRLARYLESLATGIANQGDVTSALQLRKAAETLSNPSQRRMTNGYSHNVDLTSRELEVLRLLTQGMTNPQIAHQLIISLHTVNAHVRSIFNKVGVNSRCAVTRYALEQSLL